MLGSVFLVQAARRLSACQEMEFVKAADVAAPGEDWHIIDALWLQRWRKYVQRTGHCSLVSYPGEEVRELAERVVLLFHCPQNMVGLKNIVSKSIWISLDHQDLHGNLGDLFLLLPFLNALHQYR